MEKITPVELESIHLLDTKAKSVSSMQILDVVCQLDILGFLYRCIRIFKRNDISVFSI